MQDAHHADPMLPPEQLDKDLAGLAVRGDDFHRWGGVMVVWVPNST